MLPWLYRNVLKPTLFRFDPEVVHDRFVTIGELLGRSRAGRAAVRSMYGFSGGDAAVVVDGLRYDTPLVLAAGFDYNGRLTRILKSVGFGGVEVGSVTARPTAGNPPPRLTRLVRSESLLVNKGLRNDGVEVIARRLEAVPREDGFVIGVSIARTNDERAASTTGGIDDYVTSLAHLVDRNVGEYYTLNISCPNVFGGESFATADRLRALLQATSEVRHDRPVYVKMPINVAWDDFHAMLRVIDDVGLHGVVIGNLNKEYGTLTHPEEAPAAYRGGLSGRPCSRLSTSLVHRTRLHYGSRFTIFGCGGVLSVQDGMEKFRAGADLVQLITGMIFEGPHLMRGIAAEFARQRPLLTPSHLPPLANEAPSTDVLRRE